MSQYSANIRDISIQSDVRADKFFVFVVIREDNGVVGPIKLVCIPSLVFAQFDVWSANKDDPRHMVRIDHHDQDDSLTLYLPDRDVDLEPWCDIWTVLTHPDPTQLPIRNREGLTKRRGSRRRAAIGVVIAAPTVPID
jgi:hypothetical protein